MSDLRNLRPKERFSDRADDYARWRPSYPPAAIDAVLAGLGPASALRAADIGAGTGIASRLLADRGVAVVAVEPNRAMQAAAAPHARVRFVHGTAEVTGLADGAFDLVVCAQAFHWFDGDRALAEFHRVLRRGGRVALAWNERDRSDPLTGAYGGIIERAAAGNPALHRSSYPGALFASALFHGAREQQFAYAQPLDRAGLLGRASSSSYVPLDGPERERLEDELGQLFDRFATDGVVRLAYVTRLFLAES